VFSCLATAVGSSGCGFEHQLQSLRVALNPQAGVNLENVGFVRANAYLATILVTDEDDCSAEPDDTKNNGMFLEKTVSETASLRCAARGHNCGGSPIPAYTPQFGYTGTGFTTALANCAAKDPPVPPNPAMMPLIGVQAMVDTVLETQGYVTDSYANLVASKNSDGSLNYATVPKPAAKILVSGIIGWLPDAPLNSVQTNDQYRIGKDVTSLPPQNTYWDYMPVCLAPASPKSKDGSIYKAYAGLRLKKFIDAFGKNGQRFSICNPDFSDAMTAIGKTIVQAMTGN
jgi:hypothetical protein